MQFFILALASLAIATPVAYLRSADNVLVARQNAYAGYQPQGNGGGNIRFDGGNNNGNSGGSGNGNGNSGNGNNGNGNGSGNGNGGDNNGGGISPGRPGSVPIIPANPISPIVPANPISPIIPALQEVNPCTGLADTPQCCATNVLGLASLDCDVVPDAITSRDNFVAQCASVAQIAQCCVLPLLDQGLVCSDVN